MMFIHAHTDKTSVHGYFFSPKKCLTHRQLCNSQLIVVEHIITIKQMNKPVQDYDDSSTNNYLSGIAKIHLLFTLTYRWCVCYRLVVHLMSMIFCRWCGFIHIYQAFKFILVEVPTNRQLMFHSESPKWHILAKNGTAKSVDTKVKQLWLLSTLKYRCKKYLLTKKNRFKSWKMQIFVCNNLFPEHKTIPQSQRNGGAEATKYQIVKALDKHSVLYCVISISARTH